MPIDPDLARMTEQMTAAGIGSLLAGDPEEARARARYAREQFYPPVLQDVGPIEDSTIAGPAGDVPIRIFRPVSEKPIATVVYFHGGGWIIGDLDSHDGHTRRLAATVPAVVVSVEYRLAPENPFPAGYDDAVAAAKWVAEHLADLGGTDAPMAVAGDSAGGNLAAAVALTFRDEHIALGAQLLIYPAVELGEVERQQQTSGDGPDPMTAGGDGETVSSRYLGGDLSQAGNPHASPGLAPDHAGLAPAVIGIGEFDPLRPECLRYAQSLRKAGVPVILRDYPGLIHGFFGMGSVSAAAEKAADQLSRDLADLLSP